MTSMLSRLASAFHDERLRVDESSISQTGDGDLESWFAVSDLAVATIGMAGLMLSEFAATLGGRTGSVNVDRRLASLWFGWTLRPLGWTLPAPWDPLAGDYRARDAWIRLHTNAPAHRAAVLAVLGRQEHRAALSRAVSLWEAESLEAEIVEAGGMCGAHAQFAGLEAPPAGCVGRERAIGCVVGAFAGRAPEPAFGREAISQRTSSPRP